MLRRLINNAIGNRITVWRGRCLHREENQMSPFDRVIVLIDTTEDVLRIITAKIMLSNQLHDYGGLK